MYNLYPKDYHYGGKLIQFFVCIHRLGFYRSGLASHMTVVRTGREASTGYKHCCLGQRFSPYCTQDEFLDEILSDKSLKSFPPCYHNHLYSFALRFLFLQITQHLIYFFKLTQPLMYFYSSVTVLYRRKKEELIENQIPNRDFKSENSQDYAQKPERNYVNYEFGLGLSLICLC
jgi:hypothetical protein